MTVDPRFNTFLPVAAGYSGTPLPKKLGIKPGCKVHLVGAPEGYRKLLEPLPDSVQLTRELSESVDLVQIFTSRQAELKQALATCRKRLNPAATVWMSWPKKAAKVPTDITEDTIRDIALPLGFVDVKVCAVDDVWSGLKLVVRRELR